MRKYYALSILLILGTMLTLGCGKEADSPVLPSDIEHGTVSYVPDAFATALNPDGSSGSYGVYLPPNYDANRATGYPVLYLLHGFGGNEYYFTGIFNAPMVADKLIAEGTIDEMIMVFPSGKNMLGGSFYTDSPHPGVSTSDTHIINIVNEVDATYNTIATQAGRAIGGTSMGGFGAVSVAMNNPGIFGSVSSLTGPLSFLGGQLTPGDTSDDAYLGVASLLPQVLVETGYGEYLADNPAGDATVFRQMMYPGSDRIITSFMFAASAAWSPMNPANPGPTSIAQLPDGTAVGVDLPINIDGSIYDPVFMDRWVANYDPVNRFATQGVNILPTMVAMYLDAGEHDDLGFNFSQTFFAGAYAQAFGVGPTVNNSNGYEATDIYPGYGDLPNIGGGVVEADHTSQTFARLEGMIEFADSNF